jgi:hypothetical protein
MKIKRLKFSLHWLQKLEGKKINTYAVNSFIDSLYRPAILNAINAANIRTGKRLPAPMSIFKRDLPIPYSIFKKDIEYGKHNGTVLYFAHKEA